jgi:NAD(P)-dependent dehydrogenase (short-subunit alcohol dehydrogenase family)
MAELEGQVAFITGAARGQGRAHAVRLAEEGVDIIAVDICRQLKTVGYPMSSREDLDETVALVEGLGRKIVAAEVDVRDGDALQAAFDEGSGALGDVTIVVANAGVGPGGPLPRPRSSGRRSSTSTSRACGTPDGSPSPR